MYRNLVGRFAIAFFLSVVFASFLDVSNLTKALSLFYGVLGILYAIAISQILGISTREVRNKNARKNILNLLKSLYVGLSLDFGVTTLFVLPALHKTDSIVLFWRICLSFPTLSLLMVLSSTVHVIITFKQILTLRIQIEDDLQKGERFFDNSK